MARRKRRPIFRIEPGAAPGTLLIDSKAPHPEIQVIAVDRDRVSEEKLESPREIQRFLGKWPVVWINVNGLGDEKTLEEIAKTFGLHRLALEDVVNVHQRPKAELYDDHIYVVFRMISLQDDQLMNEQVSLFLGKDYVLTFQEREGDCFEPVRKRIREGRRLIMDSGPDYLAYALMDAVIDSYFPILERYSERMEELEAAVLAEPSEELLADIYDIKHNILAFRRAAVPMRDAINTLTRETTGLIHKETTIYLRDCYDHTLRLLEMSETYRELAFDLVNLYLSNISNKMNQIMKVLTIIATIFIPLGFIAGLYGMNFDRDVSLWNMPELGWRFGYPFALALMGIVALLLLFFFKRRNWL